VKSRNTKQKQLMKVEIDNFESFFTAEDLLEKLKKKNKNIGIATIYRFLKEANKKRDLHSYTCERKVIYSKEDNNHCHFICQKCHKIMHFDVQNIDILKKKIKGNICHFQIDVHGICDECIDTF